MIPAATDKCMRGREPVIREDGSIEIPLTQGQVAVVDSTGYGLVYGHIWSAFYDRYTRSFRAVNGKDNLKMHRVVAEAAPGLQVDHINHDTLDNRGSNLRLVSYSANQCNSRPRSGVSRFKGVVWHKGHSRWQAQTKKDGKPIYIGSFRVEEDAARAYDEAALRYFGEFAFTNEMAGLL